MTKNVFKQAEEIINEINWYHGELAKLNGIYGYQSGRHGEIWSDHQSDEKRVTLPSSCIEAIFKIIVEEYKEKIKSLELKLEAL